MAKYHLSANGPRTCKAKVRGCPLGEDAPHFSNQADAQKAYEDKMIEAFGVLSTVKRNSRENLLQSSYKARDYSIKFAKTLVTSAPVLAAVQTALMIQSSPARTRSLTNNSIVRLTSLIQKLSTKAVKHKIKMRQVKATHHADAAKRLAEIRVIASANKIKNQAQRKIALETIGKKASDLKSPFTLKREKAAKNLQLGMKLSNGKIISSLTRTQDGQINVVSTDTSGRCSILTVNPTARFDLETRRGKALKSFKNSAFAARLKNASALQKESFSVMFAAHERTSQNLRTSEVAMQNSIHQQKVAA